MESMNLPANVAAVIRGRKTEKVLGDVDACVPVPADVDARNRALVLQSIKTAGWAPFHYPRMIESIAEPWRAHVLWHDSAQNVAHYLRDDLGITTKEPQLAAACSALVLVTWLPEFYDGESQSASKLAPEEQRARDEEHLAATSAMVQNLLLMLTAHGMGTYWSSGGKLREQAIFDYLNIAHHERLLAAIFVEYPEMRDESKQRKRGSQRENRGEDWIRELQL